MQSKVEEKRNLILKMLETNEGLSNLIKRIEDLLNDNDFYKLNVMIPLIEAFKSNVKGQEILINKFAKFLENSFEEECLSLLEIVSTIESGKEKIFENLKEIYKKIDMEDIPDIIQLLPENKLNELLNENFYAYKLYSNELIDKHTLGVIIRSATSYAIQILLEDLSMGNKIEHIGKGVYSSVLATNGYVIKIGETREKYEIPYNPNFLQSLIRDRIQDERGDTIFVLEVQPMIETKNISNEEVEKIKYELEKSRIIYRDYSKDNMGRLNRLNRRVIPKGNGGIIETNNRERIKSSREVVIIDADSLEIGGM